MTSKKCTKILATDKTRPEKLKIPQIITKDKCMYTFSKRAAKTAYNSYRKF